MGEVSESEEGGDDENEQDDGENSDEEYDDFENERRHSFKKYRKDMDADEETKIFGQPAPAFPNHKWVVKWESWKFLSDYIRKARYTDPDRFDMHVYTDQHGWGLQEQMQNMVGRG